MELHAGWCSEKWGCSDWEKMFDEMPEKDVVS